MDVSSLLRKYIRNIRVKCRFIAEELPYKEVTLEEAVGNMSADTIYLYPPGDSDDRSGEIITKRLADNNIEECYHLDCVWKVVLMCRKKF